MKYFFFTSIFLLLSSFAIASLPEKHQKNCETHDVKSLMGKNGSCRIVVVPKKFKKSGVCSGKFVDLYTCTLTFAPLNAGVSLSLICEDNLKAPVLNQEMVGKAMSYDVATLIETDDGRSIVKNDEMSYSMISNSMTEIHFSGTTAEILFYLSQDVVPLTDVTCK